jgi:glycosyltransferase involved in cell wall biosynthesis
VTRVAAVIPAYNEAGTIRDIAQRTLRQIPWLIVVDDGSDDGTGKALAGLPLTLLRNPENSGKAASLWRGIQQAVERGADAVVTLDGDGQHLPEDIPRLIDAYSRHQDAIVIGSRLHDRDNIPRDRYFANRFANFWIGWAAGRAITDSQSGFRVYPTTLFRALRVSCGRAAGFVFESEVLIEAARCGIEFVAVPVAAIYEQRGRRSHFRPVLDIARITRMVAWKLILRGLDLPGLVRSLRDPQPRPGDGLTGR